MKKLFLSLCSFVVLFLVSTTHASAANWYIDNTATGTDAGTSWTDAWPALTSANFASMAAGDTLYISGGSVSKTYTGTLTVASGTADGITITKGVDAGHNGEVILDGAGATAHGIYINATTTPLTNLTISNLTINRYTFAGIRGYGSNTGGLQYFTIDNCRFTDFQRAGVFVEGNNNLINNHNVVVKNSYFNDDDLYTDQSDGIYAQVLTSFTADNNYILLDNDYIDPVDGDLHSDNIQSYLVDNLTYSNNILLKPSPDKTGGVQMLFSEGGFGTHIYYNNVLIRNTPGAVDSAIRIKGTDPTALVYGNSYYGYGPVLNSSTVSVIRNNIFYGLGQPVTSIQFIRTLAGSTVTNNIFYDPNNQFPTPTGGVEINPLFVDTNFALANLHLQRTSPAIGFGLDLGASYNTDIDGTSRDSSWDAGAYEYIPLTVTIDQAVGQSDPTTTSPINFTVVFSESVSDFSTGDVTLTGTAGATTATVTGSGTTYNVEVSGMTGPGTVIASILADQATGATSNTNEVSTSTDNTVTFDASAPTGGSITYTDGYYDATSVNLTLDDGDDSGAGIDTSSRTVERQSATLSAGSCGAYNDFATITPTGTYPDMVDSTVISANCYIYRYLVSDNLANQATYTSTNEAKIDTSAPTTPGTPTTTTPTSSSTQAWTWTASTDAVSAVASYSWRTTGTAIATGSTITNSVSTSLTEGTYSFFVTAIDSAGNEGTESEAGTLTVTAPPSTPAPAQNTTSTSDNTSHSSTPSAPTCSDRVLPGPELFQGDVKGNSVKLFFTPFLNTDKFYLSYSTNTNAEEHGVEMVLAREGVQNYTVNLLRPGSIYYFKIRGQNGCMPGNWSNIISVKVGSAAGTSTISYYMNSVISRITSTISRVTAPRVTSPTSTTQPPTTPSITTTPDPVQVTTPTVQQVTTPTQTFQPAPITVTPVAKQFCFLWWCW